MSDAIGDRDRPWGGEFGSRQAAGRRFHGGHGRWVARDAAVLCVAMGALSRLVVRGSGMRFVARIGLRSAAQNGIR